MELMVSVHLKITFICLKFLWLGSQYQCVELAQRYCIMYVMFYRLSIAIDISEQSTEQHQSGMEMR